MMEYSYESLTCPSCHTTYSAVEESANYPLLLNCNFPICSFCAAQITNSPGTEIKSHTRHCENPVNCFQSQRQALIIIDLLNEMALFKSTSSEKCKAADLKSTHCLECNIVYDSDSFGPSLPVLLSCGHAACFSCFESKKIRTRTVTYPFFKYEYACPKCGSHTTIDSKKNRAKPTFITDFMSEFSMRQPYYGDLSSSSEISLISEKSEVLASLRSNSQAESLDLLDTDLNTDDEDRIPRSKSPRELKSQTSHTDTVSSGISSTLNSPELAKYLEAFKSKRDRQKQLDAVLGKQQQRQMREFIELEDWRDRQQREKNDLRKESRRMQEERRRVREERRLIGEEWKQIDEERRLLERERQWMHEQKIRSEEERQKLEALQTTHAEKQEQLGKLIIEQHRLIEERLRNLELKKKQLHDEESLICQLSTRNCVASSSSLANELLNELPDSPPLGLPLELWTCADVACFARAETDSDLIATILLRERIDGAILSCLSFEEIRNNLKIALGDAKKLMYAIEKLSKSAIIFNADHTTGLSKSVSDDLTDVLDPEVSRKERRSSWRRTNLRASLFRRKKASKE